MLFGLVLVLVLVLVVSSPLFHQLEQPGGQYPNEVARHLVVVFEDVQEDLAEEQSSELKAIIDYSKSNIRLRQVMATTLATRNIQMSSK